MSDTTIVLSLGTQDGAVMDSTLVTQSDQVTQAKRQRVQIGGNSGTALLDVVAADPGKNPNSIPALATAIVSDARPTGYIDGEVRPLSVTSDGRLRTAASQADSYIDFFGDMSPLTTDPDDSAMEMCAGFPYGMV